MPNMNIPLPEELHKKLKMAALMADMPLKDFFTQTLEASLKKTKKRRV